MIVDTLKLFNYKGYDILVKGKGEKYHVGIRGENKAEVWFKSITYNCLTLAVTSGRDYARIKIDKMLLTQKGVVCTKR